MSDPRVAFISAATWHGRLEPADAILASHPGLRTSDIHTTAILGDDAGVRRFLEQDPASVRATSEPYGGDPLVYLCLSKYLRLDPARSPGFIRAATALLDAGADPNTGFWNKGEYETALYGAAGVAHHAGLTRLLLDRGADPNDVEVVYHSPEGDDLDAFKAVVNTGRLTQESLTSMLVRKLDWHDKGGVEFLLSHGVDPDRMTRWGHLALHHALRRDNSLEIIQLLLDHGANPLLVSEGRSSVAWAARKGRRDVLDALERRGHSVSLAGVDRLIAACAMDDAAAVRAIAESEPALVDALRSEGATLLAEFAGTENTAGVGHLLDLGIPIGSTYGGDGYFDIAKESTALHVAAWRMSHSTVRLLLDRGAPVDALDGNGRTPLALAVRACVDSYWTEWRTPESVAPLLHAGADPELAPHPSGYQEVDDLIRQYREKSA